MRCGLGNHEVRTYTSLRDVCALRGREALAVADYRLSAKIISRGNSQSAVASAAYRSGARLDDLRTGETHDYTRKQGVVHCAILAPDDAPDWMHDRAKLWQAVEAVERRKDAQLARELQLSLPHELTHEQRRALVHDFVREHFVSHGMVADVAIHAPGKHGDDRNHHAHVMLTMRDLTADGFGNKRREWNNPDTLLQWREAWAREQNRTLERHGHAERVDHRSYEDQGIDREPTQHMGPTATDMERNGNPSRIGGENREREDRNADRAQTHAQAAIVDLAIERERRQMHDRQSLERAWLTADLEQINHAQKQTIFRELNATNERMQATGWRKVMRDITGRSRDDRTHAAELRRALDDIRVRESERKHDLDRRHETERVELARREADAVKAREQTAAQVPGWLAERFNERATDGPAPARDAAPQAPEWLTERLNARDAQEEPPEPFTPSEPHPWDSPQPSNDRRPWEADRAHAPGRTRVPNED